MIIFYGQWKKAEDENSVVAMGEIKTSVTVMNLL